jgi:hypothetical protein
MSCCSGVDATLYLPRKRVRFFVCRALSAGRRHHACTQFANDFLRDLGILFGVTEVEAFERQAAPMLIVAMATRAVPVNESSGFR